MFVLNPLQHRINAAAILALTGLLAACQPAPASPPPLSAMPPTQPPITEMASGGVPNQLTDVELKAIGRGEATYSGYICVTTAVGCACETPSVQKVRFSLTLESKLSYQFAPLDGAAGEWVFDRAGVNQWSFGSTLTDANGQKQALLLALLSFNVDGYVLTQVANMITGEMVECPDVNFRLIESQTQMP